MAEPIYLRVADRILQRIESGEHKPGDRLPSETKLAELEGASLGTVQKGLNYLADRGVLERRHGNGTFVASAETPARDLRHFRFLGDDADGILPVYSTVIAIEAAAAQGPWADFLGPDEVFVMLRRLLNVNGEFTVFSELVLPGARFAAILDMDRRDFDGVLIRDYLTRHFNCPTLSVEQRMAAVTLPPRVCQAIGVPQHTPGLFWELRAHTYRDQPAIYQRVFVPPTDRPLQIPDAAMARRVM